MAKEPHPFAYSILIATLIVALVVATLALIAQTAFIFMLSFAAVLFALFLRAISDPLAAHTGMGPVWALSLVAFLLSVLAAITVWLLAPSVATQLGQLMEQLPQAMESLQDRLAPYPWLRRLIEQLSAQADVAPTPGQLARLTSFVSVTVGWVASALILAILALYIAAQPEFYLAGLLQLFPPTRRERMAEVATTLGHALRVWLIVRLILMLLVAVLTAFGLKLLGMPLALTLGLIAGILDFIPNIGPILAALPAALIGFAQDPITGANVILVFLVVQFLEGYIITPLVLQRTSDMPAALTLVTQVVLGSLLGLTGLFLAAPLTIVVVVLIRELYIRDTLGD